MKLREGRAERIESFRSCVPFVVLKAIQEVHHTSKQPAHLLKHLSRWKKKEKRKRKKKLVQRRGEGEDGGCRESKCMGWRRTYVVVL